MPKIEITQKDLVSTEKVYHFKIELDGNFYFFIIQTISVSGADRVYSIIRGNTYYDKGIPLKKFELNLIKRTIELMFN